MKGEQSGELFRGNRTRSETTCFLGGLQIPTDIRRTYKKLKM